MSLYLEGDEAAAHRPGDPVVKCERSQDGIRVRVTAGSAEVWVRVTPRGRRLSVAIEEGDGEVEVEWSIRRAPFPLPPVITGPFVQSPYRRNGSTSGPSGRRKGWSDD